MELTDELKAFFIETAKTLTLQPVAVNAPKNTCQTYWTISKPLRMDKVRSIRLSKRHVYTPV
jgi:hypothetical protein